MLPLWEIRSKVGHMTVNHGIQVRFLYFPRTSNLSTTIEGFPSGGCIEQPQDVLASIKASILDL